MGTIVTIDVVETGHHGGGASERDQAIEQAFNWFREVERACNRFDPDSELRRLTRQPGVPAPASDLLFSALDFVLELAHDTGGAFDPTVGRRMEAHGFNRDYRTGAPVEPSGVPDAAVSYRDVHLDHEAKTVVVDRPLVLDLGAVAKGLAIDLAAQELASWEDFAIDAGGDLYLSGRNAARRPWAVGIRHPRRDREAIETLPVSNAAVCTSGDYERPAETSPSGHHLIDPRTGASAGALASVTVVAPAAMLADALATAAFVLGPTEGLQLLARHGVEGVLYSPALDRCATPAFERGAGRG